MTDPTPRSRTPQWVKVTGIVVAISVVLLVLVMLVGGGDHGPGRHQSAGAAVSAEFVR